MDFVMLKCKIQHPCHFHDLILLAFGEIPCTVYIYTFSTLKPLHTIGKVSLNASILYKNQEICNKTNL